ncbi:MAG: SDR family oxidoreductase [Desulfobacteraceae bacterium]|nr:MAG: SDR family oxidoreductase [Desulfobacteraceae bacterium]
MFENRVAWVTGSADGMGKTTAMTMAQRGADLILCDILEEKLERTRQEIQALGRKCLAYKVDITQRSQVDGMVADAISKLGTIDFLVNNAGGPLGIPREIEAETDEDWDRVVNVNLKGAFICCRAVVPVMKEKRLGGIVSVASSAARDGGDVTGPAYAAAKAGVVGITRNLARQLAPFNIRVNAVAPGLTLTSDTQRARMMSEAYRERREKSVAATVLKRCGEPGEIAGAICFLLSEEASFITGTTLDVSGGKYFA